ncbi:SAM-dependent methyltransferase [Catenulispora pinisilvae]|uniref:SAM-dependent methyltransferase n=1 Tax=Catenulispora pinisilvae TaxID=2705253 RepID=UPI002B270083|nr:SAM-dependent methyltransferase [Catenulispora pinisilvae]
MTEWVTWRTAMERALYGPDGFYRRPGAGPAAHFRTSAHNPVFAEAVGRLLLRVDERLGTPGRLDFVDMAAGRGELAAGVVEWLAAEAPEAARRLRAVAVDLGPRPEGLPEAVEWAGAAPSGVVGLVVANEWLDNVVCDVAEVGADGIARIVEVDTGKEVDTKEVDTDREVDTDKGAERLGAVPDAEQREWLARWWPLGVEPGARAEIGLDRDAAWRSLVDRLDRGVAVAVDYSHAAADRPRFGTLTGYRDGHQVPAVPDGTCDITAHVALDSCAAALGPGIETVLTTQRAYLRELGISGARPDLALASSDPLGYLRGLSRASSAAELTDPAGLGAFGWLLSFSGC